MRIKHTKSPASLAAVAVLVSFGLWAVPNILKSETGCGDSNLLIRKLYSRPLQDMKVAAKYQLLQSVLTFFADYLGRTW